MSLAVGKKRLFLLKSIEHDTSRFWLYTEKGGSKKCKLVAMPVFAWTCFCLMFAVRFGSGCFLAGSWVSCHTTATSLYSQKGFYAVACWTWLISPYEQKGRKDSNFYVHSDLCFCVIFDPPVIAEMIDPVLIGTSLDIYSVLKFRSVYADSVPHLPDLTS